MSYKVSTTTGVPTSSEVPQLVQDLAKFTDLQTMAGEFKKLGGKTSQLTPGFNPSPLIAACGLGAIAFDTFRKGNPLVGIGLTILTLAAGYAGVEFKRVPTQAYKEISDLFDRCTTGLRTLWMMKSNFVCKELNESSDNIDFKAVKDISAKYETSPYHLSGNATSQEITARYVHTATIPSLKHFVEIDPKTTKDLDPNYKDMLIALRKEALRVLHGKLDVPVAEIKGTTRIEENTSRTKEEIPIPYVHLCKLADDTSFAEPWTV